MLLRLGVDHPADHGPDRPHQAARHGQVARLLEGGNYEQHWSGVRHVRPQEHHLLGASAGQVMQDGPGHDHGHAAAPQGVPRLRVPVHVPRRRGRRPVRLQLQPQGVQQAGQAQHPAGLLPVPGQPGLRRLHQRGAGRDQPQAPQEPFHAHDVLDELLDHCLLLHLPIWLHGRRHGYAELLRAAPGRRLGRRAVLHVRRLRTALHFLHDQDLWLPGQHAHLHHAQVLQHPHLGGVERQPAAARAVGRGVHGVHGAHRLLARQGRAQAQEGGREAEAGGEEEAAVTGAWQQCARIGGGGGPPAHVPAACLPLAPWLELEMPSCGPAVLVVRLARGGAPSVPAPQPLREQPLVRLHASAAAGLPLAPLPARGGVPAVPASAAPCALPPQPDTPSCAPAHAAGVFHVRLGKANTNIQMDLDSFFITSAYHGP